MVYLVWILSGVGWKSLDQHRQKVKATLLTYKIKHKLEVTQKLHTWVHLMGDEGFVRTQPISNITELIFWNTVLLQGTSHMELPTSKSHWRPQALTHSSLTGTSDNIYLHILNQKCPSNTNTTNHTINYFLLITLYHHFHAHLKNRHIWWIRIFGS